MQSESQSRNASSPAPVVALTGFMGAGKSSVGRALAALLGWPFVDLDHEIEAREQQHIREVFCAHGEAGFREIEAEVLREVLAGIAVPTVIALGGGTFVQPGNARLLRDRGAQVVFLEAPTELLLQRCQVASQPDGQNPRPLAANPEAFLALYAQRLPQYRAADLTLDAADKSFEQQAREIASRLHLESDAGRGSPAIEASST